MSGDAPAAGPGDIVLRPGPPAWATAVLAPVVAVALVAYRTVGSGLARTADDPVPPWILAVLTVAVGCALAWRSLTQRAALGPDALHSRNLTTSFSVDWDRIDHLDVLRRWGLVVIDVRIRGMRRRLRLGAATRFGGDESELVLDVLRAHPAAAALLVEHAS